MDSNTRRPLLARIAVLFAVAVVAATTVWMFTRPDQATGLTTGNNPADDPGQAPATAGSSSRRQSPKTSPEDGVVLPAGSDQVNGLPVKFPYSDLGAVAAQVSVSRAQIGLDYDTAVAAVQTYAAPGETAAFEDRARAAVAERRKAADVPADGPADDGVPAPASYAVTPVAYTLQKLDTDYYAVTLLSYITFTTAAGQTKDGFYAGTGLVQWIPDDSGGDWKLVEGSDTDVQQVLDADRPKPSAPDTPQFESEGWIQLNARLP